MNGIFEKEHCEVIMNSIALLVFVWVLMLTYHAHRTLKRIPSYDWRSLTVIFFDDEKTRTWYSEGFSDDLCLEIERIGHRYRVGFYVPFLFVAIVFIFCTFLNY
jgi:hypothetical protein